jgi:hypothetical protein
MRTNSGFGQTTSVSPAVAFNPLLAAVLVLRMDTSEGRLLAGTALDDMSPNWSHSCLQRSCNERSDALSFGLWIWVSPLVSFTRCDPCGVGWGVKGEPFFPRDARQRLAWNSPDQPARDSQVNACWIGGYTG